MCLGVLFCVQNDQCALGYCLLFKMTSVPQLQMKVNCSKYNVVVTVALLWISDLVDLSLSLFLFCYSVSTSP